MLPKLASTVKLISTELILLKLLSVLESKCVIFTLAILAKRPVICILAGKFTGIPVIGSATGGW